MTKSERSVINLFIVFMLGLIIFGSLPFRTRLTDQIQNFFAPVQYYFGLTQKWNMFAPNPGGMNSYVDVDIKLNDTSHIKWQFPRAQEMGFLDKSMNGERYRKLYQERLTKKLPDFAWKDIAEYVTRQVQASLTPEQHILKLTFSRHFKQVPLPDQEFRPYGQLTQNFESEVLYEYSASSYPTDNKVMAHPEEGDNAL